MLWGKTHQIIQNIADLYLIKNDIAIFFEDFIQKNGKFCQFFVRVNVIRKGINKDLISKHAPPGLHLCRNSQHSLIWRRSLNVVIFFIFSSNISSTAWSAVRPVGGALLLLSLTLQALVCDSASRNALLSLCCLQEGTVTHAGLPPSWAQRAAAAARRHNSEGRGGVLDVPDASIPVCLSIQSLFCISPGCRLSFGSWVSFDFPESAICICRQTHV